MSEDVGKLDLSYTASGDVKWFNHFGKQFISFLKLNIYSTYYPAIPLLDIHPVEMKAYNHTKTCAYYQHLYL